MSVQSIDLTAVKQRQQAAWSAGDYAVVGTTLQIVGESLCEAGDLRSGEKVLDVAAGNGNATLAAARRFARVTSTDFVPALLEKGRLRAAAEGLAVTFDVADAEVLPYSDASFDVALSTFGVMFAPAQERAASELARVVRPGGRIGLANWTPEGFVGQLFRVLAKYAAPPAGVRPASLWGTSERLEELFGAVAASIDVVRREFVFRYRSPEHWLGVFRDLYGPVERVFSALSADAKTDLSWDLLELVEGANRSGDGTVVVPSEYLEVVVVRS